MMRFIFSLSLLFELSAKTDLSLFVEPGPDQPVHTIQSDLKATLSANRSRLLYFTDNRTV